MLPQRKEAPHEIQPHRPQPLPNQCAAKRPLEEIGVMKRFVIERNIPDVGQLDAIQLRNAAQKSNAVLSSLGTAIQWQHSYRAQNKLVCVYLATNESLIRQHAELSGFPANAISEVDRIIDPTTATCAT
jgi:hypothetical protein